MFNECAIVNAPLELITQSESSGSGTAGNQLPSNKFSFNAWMIFQAERCSGALGRDGA